MKSSLITTCLFICCFFAATPTSERMSGKWTGLLKTDQGEEYALLYNFKIDGDTLTGTAKTPKGILPIYDGKVSGDSFTFDVVINHLEIDHSGKFYGDSVGVDISLGDQKAHATLKRAE